MFATKLRSLVYLGLLVSAVAFADPGADIASKPVKKAPILTIVVTGGPNSKTEGWKRLQAFQNRLRDLLDVPVGENLQSVDIGCAACPDIEDRVVNGETKSPANPPNKLKYIFYGEDREKVSVAFTQAWNDVWEQDQFKDDGFKMEVNGEPVAGGACSDPALYVQPCYSRPVCTLYQGCSKSQTSCVKCPKP